MGGNPAGAAAFLEDAVYYWNDIEILAQVETWVARWELSNHIVGWINLTYHPAYRERLRPVALRVLSSHSHVLGS